MIETSEGFELDLKDRLVSNPAMGRDTSYRATPNLTLYCVGQSSSIPRDELILGVTQTDSLLIPRQLDFKIQEMV